MSVGIETCYPTPRYSPIKISPLIEHCYIHVTYSYSNRVNPRDIGPIEGYITNKREVSIKRHRLVHNPIQYNLVVDHSPGPYSHGFGAR